MPFSSLPPTIFLLGVMKSIKAVLAVKNSGEWTIFNGLNFSQRSFVVLIGTVDLITNIVSVLYVCLSTVLKKLVIYYMSHSNVFLNIGVGKQTNTIS